MTKIDRWTRKEVPCLILKNRQISAKNCNNGDKRIPQTYKFQSLSNWYRRRTKEAKFRYLMKNYSFYPPICCKIQTKPSFTFTFVCATSTNTCTKWSSREPKTWAKPRLKYRQCSKNSALFTNFPNPNLSTASSWIRSLSRSPSRKTTWTSRFTSSKTD